jgi:hypothetical protein
VILLLAYFPTLFEDELLYSGIARYHQHSGNRTQKQTVNDLFEDHLVCATVDLPSHLEQLSRRIRIGYTTDQLIEKHTLYPYYAYYMEQGRRAEAKTLMGKGSTEGVLHAFLGLLAGRIKAPYYLRYCPACVEEERGSKEPYWHRSHQLPGVVFCPIHNVLLKQGNVAFSTRDHKFAFVPLTEIEPGKSQPITINADWNKHLLFIAEQSSRILECASGQALPNYRGILAEKNYITVGGKVRFDRLIDDVQDFYGKDLLRFLNCEITLGSDTWLHKLIRGEAEINQPLRHLLLLRYFGQQVGATFQDFKYSPFGNGPWPCLNKAADHYRSNVVEKCVITRCSKTKLPVGTFSCVCGFVYSRRGPDKNAEDWYRIGRIKDFGPTWKGKLMELNNHGGLSLRAKAVILGVDPTTVKKQSLPFSKEKVPVIQKNTISPDQTGRPNEFKSRAQRVDWNLRDELIFAEAKEAVRKLRQLDKPHRISLSSIAKNMPTYGLSLKILKQDAVKLPKTKKYLLSAIESTTEFQIRRLEWAAIKLRAEEYKIMGWKLLRLAGLRSPLSDPVLKKYNELLEMK